jgi:hypothetical protein
LGKLFNTIKALVIQGRYVIGDHASNRLDEREVLEWQAVDGIQDGKLSIERLRDKPNPSIEVLQILPDGTDIKAVWSHIRSIDMAKLVTVHFMDEEE